jgi:dihydrofolate reductase
MNAIVAYNDHFVIGDKDGRIPWRIKAEIEHFKQVTMGHTVIMGRKTWDSIPSKFRPLPGRTNIVLSKSVREFPGAHQVISLQHAMKLAEEINPGDEPILIGGAQVYLEAIENGLLSSVLATHVHGHTDVDAGAYFPNLKAMGWSETLWGGSPEYDVYLYLPPR